MQLTAPADRTTESPRTTRRTGIHDTDGMAVASFVLGLLGLLVLNVFLGPVAIALLVLVAFMSADSTLSWSL